MELLPAGCGRELLPGELLRAVAWRGPTVGLALEWWPWEPAGQPGELATRPGAELRTGRGPGSCRRSCELAEEAPGEGGQLQFARPTPPILVRYYTSRALSSTCLTRRNDPGPLRSCWSAKLPGAAAHSTLALTGRWP